MTYRRKGLPPATIAVASGKGGVGKSNIALNLATLWCSLGRRVLVFDADLALANIHVLLGISPILTLTDCLTGKASPEEILVRTPIGIDILPAGSGTIGAMDVEPGVRDMLIERVSALVAAYDVMLVDTAAGLTENILAFASACDETLVVTTPEPTALTDAYALMKLLLRRRQDVRIRIAMNMTTDAEAGARAAEGLQTAVKRFLDGDVGLAGQVRFDPLVGSAVRRQKPFVTLFPERPASRELRAIAERLSGEQVRRSPGPSSWKRKLTGMVFGSRNTSCIAERG